MPETVSEFDPLAVLARRFRAAIAAAVPEAGADADPLISASRQEALGDFQSNAAMPLGKKLGRAPREVAQAIVARLDIADIAEPVTEKSIAGPGFINIRLRGDAMARLLEGLDSPGLGIEAPAEAQAVVVDLVGVNLSKQMHVGHLRSTIIGDALARTLARLGHRVIRQNHVGDWGLPIAMVTDKVMRLSEAGELDLSTLKLDDLNTLYRSARRDCDADVRGLNSVRRFGLGPKAEAELAEQVAGAQEAMASAKQTLVNLQSHEPKTYAVWQRIADITMEACLSTVARLHAVVTRDDSAGESSYSEELPALVQDLLDRGVAEIDQGAVIVRVQEFGIAEPCLIRKSDGGFLYATTDMAAIRRRVQKLGADRVIYCVDARQGLHFKQVFAAATKAGYATRADGKTASLEHAAFGMVLGDDGRPFKTRSGENVRLSDLVDEAVSRAERVVGEKSPELPETERRSIAEAVGVAALRYADLSMDRVKDYVFSFDRMLAFEGNTGPYLLNALVRIRSIFRKAAERGVRVGGVATLRIAEPAEKTLALALLRYPATVRAVGDSLEPHRLCQYLFDLATSFSAFYENCPVLGAEDEAVRDSRLRLCDLTARVLEDGLSLLGLPALERM
jgi:arginyl-tRNA synthetase